MTQGIVFQSSTEHKNYSFQQILYLQLSRTIQCCKLLARFAASMFMRIRPMESNLLNSASDFLYDTHFYFNILSLAAIISARWLHCHKHGKCYSIVSCSPRILIGAQFSSLAISQLHDLSLFKKMMKKRPCSEITAFKNSDPGHRMRLSERIEARLSFGSLSHETSPIKWINKLAPAIQC
jgi:hypothetical protein